MSVIEEFLSAYERQFDYWESAANRARLMIEAGLSSSGLRAIATSRAKSIDKLAEKLIKRDRETHYEDVSQVFGDIVDLAGVRVALYFPGQVDETERLVRSLFEVESVKRFPESAEARPNTRFSGYSARHFRVHIPLSALSDEDARFANALVEVQVASVLMHAWAEVDHDLVYKPTVGDLSPAEYALLDQLNGLVLSGEIALEQLQAAADRRVLGAQVDLHDRYELAEYLRTQLATGRAPAPESELGGVDVLFEYLLQRGLVKPAEIGQYLSELEGRFESGPLADQILDFLVAGRPDQYEVLRDAAAEVRAHARKKDSSRESAVDAAVGIFIRKWAEFESLLADVVPGGPRIPVNQRIAAAHDAGILDSELLVDLQFTRSLRNRLVHGRPLLRDSDQTDLGIEVERATRVLDEAIRRLQGPTPRSQ